MTARLARLTVRLRQPPKLLSHAHPVPAGRRRCCLGVGRVARYLALCLALAGASAGDAHAQSGTAADAGSSPDAQLVGQKLRLLNYLLGSPTGERIRSGGDANAKSSLAEIEDMAARAVEALNAGAVDQAAPLVDKGLKQFSFAVKSLKTDTQKEDRVQQARFEELREGVRTFRKSLLEAMAQQPDEAIKPMDTEELNRLVNRADRFAEGERYEDANELLSRAYEMTVTALAKLRESETIVYRLEFASPVEEYQYETSRADSHEELVNVLRARGAAAGTKSSLVDRYLAQSRDLRGRAEAAANAQDFETAIELTRKATDHLNRSLRLMGVQMTQ